MRCSLLSLTVLANLATTALAQPAAPPKIDDAIIVTGEAASRAKARAQSYLHELGVANGEKPTARWMDPICPQALGLVDQQAAIVEAQLRKSILRVGAPFAKAGCHPNLLVAFTDDAPTLVRSVRKHNSQVERNLTGAQVRELTEGTLPVRWWYDTEHRTSEGQGAGATTPPALSVQGDSGLPGFNGSATFGSNGDSMSLRNASNIGTQSVRAIFSAVVIVDSRRINGAALSSLVDYATLVGLAEIRLGTSSPGSIMSLFAGTAPQQELTARDLRFLTGLYKVAMDRGAEQQRRSIMVEMIKADPGG